MAHSLASSPAGSDGATNAGRPWRRNPPARFEWIAPSPSPAEVAELERLFPDIIQIPAQSLEVEANGWVNNSIIARSLSRWVPPEAIIREFHRAGVAGEIEAVSLAHRHYFFRFSDPQARDFVLGRPWVANGQLIAVAEWQSEFIPAADTLLSALIWIRLPLLPLDFWTEEILSAVLSVAGEYRYSDDATKLKNRGGFARACVRVDVGKPLRPGTRVRGNKAPFWQQFSYENVEGICDSCGALHFDGKCISVPEQAPSSDGPKFGPWMAAVRRRRSPQLHSSDSRKTDQVEVRPASASGEGWQFPKKIARRQGSKLPPDGQHFSSVKILPDQSKRGPAQACRSTIAVPVLATISQAEIQLAESVQPENRDLNPFSTLGLGAEAVCPEFRMDSTPGPSKRARPVESNTQRVASKSNKVKGKAPLAAKGKEPASFTFSASLDSVRGSGGLTRRGTKKLRCMAGPNPGAASGIPQQEMMVGYTHESAVYQLKQAIQQVDSGGVMDSSRLEEFCGKEPVEGSPPVSGPSDAEMPGDRIEVLPTHVSG